MTSDISYFEERGEKLKGQIAEVENKNRRLSALRLIFFVMIIISIAVAIFNPALKIFALCAAVVFIGIFAYLCNIHGKSKTRYDHLTTLDRINSQYIARINGDFEALSDRSEERKPDDHDYAFDLDIFGPRSLFTLYNITETYMGRREFARELLGYNEHDNIPQRQKACAELISKKEFLQEFEAIAALNKMPVMPKHLTEFYEGAKPFDKNLKILYKVLPALWLIPIVMLILGNKFFSAAIIGIAIINLIVWFLISSRFAERFNSAAQLSKQASGYAALYEVCEKEGFSDPLIKELIKGGAPEGHKASEGLKSLSSVCSLCALRSQPMFAFLINAVFPFDLLCADKLMTWSVDHSSELKTDLSRMTDLEVLMCCSVVGIVSRESTFPEITEGAVFEGKDITHPLLDPKKAVSNSISLTAGTALITGSNMSGKTTLIRTVGIMCILGYTGAPVPASYVRAGKMRVMSSMRIMDSIEEQMSTFRAELVRIAKIVDAGKEERPLLFLIDEIFRGTNSADRTEGALKVIENLSKPHIMGLMTTHDYALCDKVTETVKTVVYYHFSEKYNDDGITFDYKLHNGVSHESNAKFLMRLVGIY